MLWYHDSRYQQGPYHFDIEAGPTDIGGSASYLLLKPLLLEKGIFSV